MVMDVFVIRVLAAHGGVLAARARRRWVLNGRGEMSEPDRTKLPIRRPPFGGVCNKTLAGSEPDWNLIGHPEPPPGAPNVLLVLIDDAGFGNPAT